MPPTEATPVFEHAHAASGTHGRPCALAAPRTLLFALILAAPLPGGGCTSSDTNMMPAPLAYREAHANALRQTPRDLLPPPPRTTIVPILYATNRTPDGDGDHGVKYGSSNGRDIRLGAAEVRLGPEGEEGWDLDRLNRETLAGAEPPMSVALVEEFGLLDSDDGAQRRFVLEIDRALVASTQPDIFVYVPGFNITFEAAVRRSAEFWHYLGRAGVFVTYAWPAHSHPFFYSSDFRCAAESADGFTRFLRYLRNQTGARRIHILTSSAGAPMVTAALASLSAKCPAPPTPSTDFPSLPARTGLGQVVYAAPDQDIDGFRAFLLCGGADACEHITVYCSASDLGLLLSRFLGSGNQTVGRLPVTLTEPDAALLRRVSERLTVVDATNAVAHAGGGDFWSHGYWYLNPWVSSDVLAVLRDGQPPAARALVPTLDGAMWSFPDDYPERLRQAPQR